MPAPLPPTAPKISVLVPTYNYARFLSEALDSVLGQTETDCEIIVSDDASTDHSVGLIGQYAARDARIRPFLHPQNLGMVANWNFCLAQARGRYVKFLFGDDALVTPQALARPAGALDRNTSARLASSARLLLDERSTTTGCWNDLPTGTHQGPALLFRCLRTRRNLIGEPTAVMFRRADAQRGFDPGFRQIVDLEMWFHLLLAGPLVHVATPLCAFRRHAGQQTEVNRRSRVTDRETLELIARYLDAPALRPYLQRNGFAHRQILFRQMHYMRKARTGGPETSAMLRQIRDQLPWPWLAGCWLWHRVSRPFENLRRKFRQWSARWQTDLDPGW
jgi:glycosyltransferase involved in cell wall biosynthesis